MNKQDEKNLRIAKVVKRDPKILHILLLSGDTQIYVTPKWMSKSMNENIIKILQEKELP